jgi:hypothetical protein
MASNKDIRDNSERVYQQFRKNTGHITDLDEEDVGVCLKVIEIFQIVDPSHRLHVGYGTCDEFALYHTVGKRDLSLFWKIFRSLDSKTKSV